MATEKGLPIVSIFIGTTRVCLCKHPSHGRQVEGEEVVQCYNEIEPGEYYCEECKRRHGAHHINTPVPDVIS